LQLSKYLLPTLSLEIDPSEFALKVLNKVTMKHIEKHNDEMQPLSETKFANGSLGDVIDLKYWNSL